MTEKTKSTRAINTQHFQPVREIEEIAQELEVSHQRCSFLLRSALAKLKAELARRGIDRLDQILPD